MSYQNQTNSQKQDMLIPLARIQALIAPRGLSLAGMRCLHVGASLLQERDDYAAHSMPVVWVEAQPELVQKMRTQYPNDTILQACVANKTGSHVLFKETRDSQTSSMLPLTAALKQQYRFVDIVRTYRLKTWRLDDLMAEHNLNPQFDFLNLDIQGAEMQALQSLSAEMWAALKIVYLEINTVEFYKTAAKPAEFDEMLAQHGFEKVATQMHSDTANFGDVLYVRSQ